MSVFVFGHGAVVRECAREKLIVALTNKQTDGQKDERTDRRSVPWKKKAVAID